MKKIFLAALIIILTGLGLYPFYYESKLKSFPELKTSYPALEIPAGTILMVFAHSDDEIGIMAQIAELRRKNPASLIKWYIVSDGGRGFVFWGSCGDLDKPACRLNEASKVADCAGIPHPKSLNLPDGKISETKNLDQYLLRHIPEFKAPDLKYVFTHDKRGLYGHPDHVAVYDAVSKILSGTEVPLISMALPDYFKKPRIMMGPGKNRMPETITHALELNPDLIKVKTCVAHAHASQKLILNLLFFKGLSAEAFFQATAREFLNSSFIPAQQQAPTSNQ